MSTAAKVLTPQEWLCREVRRHSRWRWIWSTLFFGIAGMTIVSGAATTVAAGILEPEEAKRWTLWLAALTTVLASFEKVLRLREKWDLHRNIQTSLEIVLMQKSAGLIGDRETIRLVDQVAKSYSTNLAELTSPVHANFTPAQTENGEGD